jgi:hypothetical protein
MIPCLLSLVPPSSSPEKHLRRQFASDIAGEEWIEERDREMN